MRQPKKPHLYEIFLASGTIPAHVWQKLFDSLASLSRFGERWQIFTHEDHAKLHFYLKTTLVLPANLPTLPDFFFQITDAPTTLPAVKHLRIYPVPPLENFIRLRSYFTIKQRSKLTSLQITFSKLAHTYLYRVIATVTQNGRHFACPLLAAAPAKLLSVDFASSRHLIYKSVPKYLDAQKILPFLEKTEQSALFQIEAFPYQAGCSYLHHRAMDFAKHSLVLGASGSGKSKFLSLLIEKLATDPKLRPDYKIVVIDPHAALENDIGAYARTIDFLSEADSIQPFDRASRDPVVATELMLEFLKNLLADNYNPKITRVLRHSISILISLGEFDFHHLGELLLNLDYRNQILQDHNHLPISSRDFFLTEYNGIKTRFYTEAISPIIALIDEIKMIPVFGSPINAPDLNTIVTDNFLTLFSFDRTKLGDRVTTILSGIIMQQLFTLAQNHAFKEHIIFIIDEVAVVENPILKRFLSEARKFNLSLMLAGQYFGAISDELRSAIFANTTNYFIFHVAKDDAALLSQSLDLKIPLDDTPERKIKTLTDLQNRECVARVSCDDQLLPGVKGRTLDFTPRPRIKTTVKSITRQPKATVKRIFHFTINTAPKFQTFITTSKHHPRRIITSSYDQYITEDPTQIKLTGNH